LLSYAAACVRVSVPNCEKSEVVRYKAPATRAVFVLVLCIVFC
jgi:hypothetical protein